MAELPGTGAEFFHAAVAAGVYASSRAMFLQPEDSTTVLLYKMMRAAVAARPGRTEIVIDRDNFPTDRYVAAGIAEECGLTLRWIEVDTAAGVTAATWLEAYGKKDVWKLMAHDQAELLDTTTGDQVKNTVDDLLSMTKTVADDLGTRYQQSAPYVLHPELRTDHVVALEAEPLGRFVEPLPQELSGGREVHGPCGVRSELLQPGHHWLEMRAVPNISIDGGQLLQQRAFVDTRSSSSTA